MKNFCKETFLKDLDEMKSLNLLKHNSVSDISKQISRNCKQKCIIRNTFKKREKIERETMDHLKYSPVY